VNGWLLAFDVLLLVTLVWVAWRALAEPRAGLFRAVVLFIAFGLLLAVAWVRLSAPDVALAEAAIGAGVTGALLLVTLGRLESSQAGRDGEEAE
jgi:energy-converting hydrogenase B subunit D